MPGEARWIEIEEKAKNIDTNITAQTIAQIDKVLENEEKRNEMLSEMQKQKQMTIKTEEGHNISRSILKRAVWEDEAKIIEYLEGNNKHDLIKKVINTNIITS